MAIAFRLVTSLISTEGIDRIPAESWEEKGWDQYQFQGSIEAGT